MIHTHESIHRKRGRIRVRREMRRRPIFIVLALVMVLGIAVYLRLWIIQYKISSDDAELLRRQFDLANREAMDESAEWRLKYDQEFERASKCMQKLTMMKESLENGKNAVTINKKLEMLQKENMDLLERVESLKQELETEKLKCSGQ